MSSKPNPAEIRKRFGANLRQLSARAPSISALCRQIGINRTQYNRYLSSESFPRPDILQRICDFFSVDARILLEPLDNIERHIEVLTTASELRGFLSDDHMKAPSEAEFPSGFYRFSRQSFIDTDRCVLSHVHVYRRGAQAFLRGLEAREAMAEQGLPNDRALREYRGLVMPQYNGVSILLSRRAGQSTSFNYLQRLATFESNFWVGYTARTAPEHPSGTRFARQVYEYMGPKLSDGLRAARCSGLVAASELPPFHRQQIRLGQPFA